MNTKCCEIITTANLTGKKSVHYGNTNSYGIGNIKKVVDNQ